jgi:hypothetical protein
MPSDEEWGNAYVDGEFGQKGDAGQEDFIRGCRDGWRKASGASKI